MNTPIYKTRAPRITGDMTFVTPDRLRTWAYEHLTNFHRKEPGVTAASFARAKIAVLAEYKKTNPGQPTDALLKACAIWYGNQRR